MTNKEKLKYCNNIKNCKECINFEHICNFRKLCTIYGRLHNYETDALMLDNYIYDKSFVDSSLDLIFSKESIEFLKDII